MKSASSGFSFDGLGTQWDITIFETPPTGLPANLETSLHEMLQDFERKYSRFDTSSLIGQLNTVGKIENYPQELGKMLDFAFECEEITEGYFNIAVGGRLEDIGYDSEYTLKQSAQQRNVPSLKEVLSVSKQQIKLRKNVAIDLGGFGKGWLIDKVANYLLGCGIKSFMINGGGDIRIENMQRSEKQILLENPFIDNQAIGDISIKNGALASSSPKHRRWPSTSPGAQLHHLVNPKAKDVIEDVAAIFTQSSDSALFADTASTCLFVAPARLHEKIKHHFSVSYCIVSANGNYFKTNDYPGSLYA